MWHTHWALPQLFTRAFCQTGHRRALPRSARLLVRTAATYTPAGWPLLRRPPGRVRAWTGVKRCFGLAQRVREIGAGGSAGARFPRLL